MIFLKKNNIYFRNVKIRVRDFMTRGIFQKLTLMLMAVLLSPAGAYASSIDKEIDKYFAPFSDAFSGVVFFPVIGFKHNYNVLSALDRHLGL